MDSTARSLWVLLVCAIVVIRESKGGPSHRVWTSVATACQPQEELVMYSEDALEASGHSLELHPEAA